MGSSMGSSLSLESEAWVTNGRRLGSMLDVNVGEGGMLVQARNIVGDGLTLKMPR